MRRELRTELVKQRTTRTFVAGVLAAPVIGALVTVAVFGGSGRQGNDPLSTDSLALALGAPASVITFVALLLGVLGMTGEYRHGTITTTFLATPARSRVVMAKLAASALTGAVMAALCLAASALVAVPWLAAEDIAVQVDGRVGRVVVGLVASTPLFAALGVAIGALVRNQTGAITGVLVWLLALEGLVHDLFPRLDALRWLPASVGRAVTVAGAQHGRPDAALAAVVFTLYVAAAAVLAARFTVRRDIT